MAGQQPHSRLRDLHRVQPQVTQAQTGKQNASGDAESAPDLAGQTQSAAAKTFELAPESDAPRRRRRPDTANAAHRLIPPPPIDASSASRHAPLLPATGLSADDRVKALYGDLSQPIDLEGGDDTTTTPGAHVEERPASATPVVQTALSAAPQATMASLGLAEASRPAARRSRHTRRTPVATVGVDAGSARLCPSCEYDLRGTPDANVCPECGATIPMHVRSGRHHTPRGLDAWSWPQLARLNWGCLLMVAGILGVFPAFPVFRYFMYLRSEAMVFLFLFLSVAAIGAGAWLAGIFSAKRLRTQGIRLPSTGKLDALLQDPLQRTAFCQRWAGRSFIAILGGAAVCLAIITWHALSMRFSVTMTTIATML
ncbi:MAG: hypothetical protein ACOC0P_06860, partial [Planctomycetota bacterium]